MPLPHLHIMHPSASSLHCVEQWIAELEQALRSDPGWDGCVFHRHTYNSQAAFDVPTVLDLVRRSPGPVIMLQRVQHRLFQRLHGALRRCSSVYLLNALCVEDLWQSCEAARIAYDAGEPLIPHRELVAYLVLRKLERLGKWGGKAKNKDFLWAADLANGGFPKDCVNARDVNDVACQLLRVGLLDSKTSNGKRKYALGEKSTVKRIFDTRSLESVGELHKFFANSRCLVSVRLMDYNVG
ncbi:MAG TPA: hypothetical protein VMV10_30165 [Pirellulales bacterium]|nr:hypothetical protein [Pirellulales bacterium]